jgi:hypothetical protein
MTHARRALACCGALALLLASALFVAPAVAADPASVAGATKAVTWLETQQQSDGGFEVAGFPGFETRDAALAIAAAAQTGTTWSTTEARDVLAALKFAGNGPTPLDALDAYAATITTAGAAAKTIVLSAAPLGVDPSAFDPAGDGSPTNLVALLDSGCAANSASFGAAFSDTLYGALAKKLVCGAPPAAAVTTIRSAQQANGGWNFNGDPTGTDVDPDTTALAVEALVAAGAGPNDAAVHAALGFYATNQQASGAWQSFGSDDPNSTAMSELAITAAGFDPASACWRDTVAPKKAGTVYASPDAWLLSQQQANGRIASPNDQFPPINTFATSQTVEALLRSWLPVARASTQTCAPPPPATTTPPPTTDVTVESAVAVQPKFTG